MAIKINIQFFAGNKAKNQAIGARALGVGEIAQVRAGILHVVVTLTMHMKMK
jgi:hypothetical protein